MRRWAGRVGGALFALMIVNFLSFVALSLAWGGDTLRGKVEDGRYYLGSRGRFTEVSESRYRLGRAHARSVVLTHVLGILVGGPLMGFAARTATRPGRSVPRTPPP